MCYWLPIVASSSAHILVWFFESNPISATAFSCPNYLIQPQDREHFSSPLELTSENYRTEAESIYHHSFVDFPS